MGCRTTFDVAFTFEERVMEQLVEGILFTSCMLLLCPFMYSAACASSVVQRCAVGRAPMVVLEIVQLLCRHE